MLEKEKKVEDHKPQPITYKSKFKNQKLPTRFTEMTMDKKLRSTARVSSSISIAFLITLLGLNLAAEGSQVGSNVRAMYLLGDSSVDCGINTLFYPLLRRNFSLLPCTGDDASLLPHFLAEKIGVPYSQPLYSQNGSIEAIINGLNFGSTQATIMSNRSYQSLNQQLRQVLDAIQLLRLRLGQDNARHFIRSSIFYLSFGEIDFINLYLQNSTGVKSKYVGEGFARLLVSQMLIAIRNLYDADARKIICMGILPLGCTPRVLSQWRDSPATKYDEKGCVREINELVLKYNRLMDKHIVKLNAQFPDAQVVFCDAYKGIMEIITDPRRYGFEESKSACCGLGSYNASIGCVAMEIACSKASSYVWWDLYNPTRAVNSLLADSAWCNKPFSNFCHPLTVQDLVRSTWVSHA